MGLRNILLTALIALACGFAGAAAWSWSGLGDMRTRDYLVANPEILPEMAEAYQRRQSEERLADSAEEVSTAFPGAVLGNPEGKVTLVQFTDYACGFCRQSHPEVQALVAANPDLKVVIREWPIFPGSEDAARMALAAARQGRYRAFHDAMFEAGTPSPASVAAAARKAGLDIARAEKFAASQEAEFEIARNMALARKLGFEGTPSWIVGDRILEGAVGRQVLGEAIAQARAS